MYLGRQSQLGSNPNQEAVGVTRIINHPDYRTDTFNNDISLLQLAATVSFTAYIQPVCLAAPESTFYTGTDSWVTGWGNIGSGRGFNNGYFKFPQLVDFNVLFQRGQHWALGL